MTTAYRFYMVGEDGKICGAEVVECPTDAVALEMAEGRLAGCKSPAIEVWDRGRRIGAVGCLSERLATTEERRTIIDPSWVPG